MVTTLKLFFLVVPVIRAHKEEEEGQTEVERHDPIFNGWLLLGQGKDGSLIAG